MSIFDRIRQNIRRKSILKGVAKLRELAVVDIMTKYVITIGPDDDVIKAATKMIAEDISCLVVSDVEKSAIGVLSERDFLKKVPLTAQAFTMKAREVMSQNLYTVPLATKLTDAVGIMKARKFRRLVVAENSRMLGVVTQTDFTRILFRAFPCYPAVTELTVGHIMTKNVITVTPKNSIVQAKEKMLKNDIGAIIIADKSEVLGILTEYDVVMQFYDQRGKLDTKDISNYMRKHVRAVTPETSVFEANKLMLDKNMRRLLIVDGNRIVGIVTQTDICRYMYFALNIIEKAAQAPDAVLKRLVPDSEVGAEYRTDHLKVYSFK